MSAGGDRLGRLRLVTRLFLAFAAVASLPLIAVPFVIRQVTQSYDAAFASDLEDAGSFARSEIVRLTADIRSRTRAVIDGTLLAEIQRAVDAGNGAGLLNLAAPALTASGLDVLEVVDGEGHILLCGQLPVRLGDTDAAAHKLLATAPDTAMLIRVEHRVLDGIDQSPALVIGLPVDLPGGGGVIGGKFFDNAELQRLAQTVRGQVSLVAGTAPADTISQVPGAWLEKLFTPKRRSLDFSIRGLDGGRELHIQLPDEALVQTKRRIVSGALLAFVIGLTASVGLAAWLARRTVGPVTALLEGTRRVARGDLSSRVDVQASGELAQLVDAFNRMSADLATARNQLAHAERIAAWEQIARALAHEIKNPLTPIAMAIETLQRTHDRQHPDFDRFFQEGTATVLEEVARLKRLATEFGEFARWPKPVVSPALPGDVLRSVVQLYSSLPPPHLLHTEEAPGLPTIQIDRDQIQRALVNIVKNALEAMPGGGRVAIRAIGVDGGVAFEVADNGPGMSPEARARLFEPYFTTKPEGTGLGLAIVHRIVTEHGGKLSVDETPGGGTTFRIWLPAAAITQSIAA
jgi:signal transduction histidine kinase